MFGVLELDVPFLSALKLYQTYSCEKQNKNVFFIDITGNKVYEAQVALMQNDLFTDMFCIFTLS